MIGEILGNRYKILRDIGSGGMAWVYLAEDTHDGSLMAVKVLYPQFSEDMAYVQRFTREAKLASALSDPHIVRVLDYGATRDIHYLVMEYIEGRDLKEIIHEGGPLPYRQVLKIAAQVAKALQHASKFGIVHRDIKPQNLMITADGTVKVLDFGIARASTLSSLTQSGFVGSPHYISPEQAMGEEVDIRSDIYSLGVVMYEMLSGEVPFEAKSPWSIISQHIASDPPPLRLDENDLPETVEQLVNKMLTKRPEDRFQTPRELLQAIEPLIADKEVPTEAAAPPPSQTGTDILLQGLYERAMEASQAQEWQKAIELFNQILKLAPGYKDVVERLAKAEKQSQPHPEQTHLENLYSAARWDLEEKRWKEAIDKLSEIIAIEPTYRDVAQLLTEAGIAFSEAKTKGKIAVLYKQGVSHVKAQNWEEALACFSQVYEMDPHYEQTQELLARSRSRLEKAAPAIEKPVPEPSVEIVTRPRRRLPAAILLLVVAVGLLVGAPLYAYQHYRQIKAQDTLEVSYQRALDYLAQGQWSQAIEEFDRLLAIAPDYKDAAQKREEARQKRDQAAGQQQLDHLYAEGQKYYDHSQWEKAIAYLEEVRALDPVFQKAAVEGMLCQAYLEHGKAQVKTLDDENEGQRLEEAIIILGQGLDICSEEKSLREEMGLALLYQEALALYPQNKWSEVITKLRAIYETRPDYGGGQVARRLYRAYLERGDWYRQQAELIPALEDYEAALQIKEVADRSVARERRDGVLVLLGTPATATLPLLPPSTPTPSPTPTPTRIFEYPAPALSSPPNGALLVVGEFAEVYLEWEPVAGLAKDEFYNVTVIHFYNGEEVYWGDATKETQIRFPPGAGYGQADKDLFHWWVEVRQTRRIKEDGRPDGPPISPKSEAWTFTWR